MKAAGWERALGEGQERDEDQVASSNFWLASAFFTTPFRKDQNEMD